MARLDWTYDELVLAADLVADNNWQGLRAHNPLVIQLSGLLRSASIHPTEGRADNFRSTHSVQRKTFDLSTQHPNYTGKPTRGSRLDLRVLEEFLADPELMKALALEIREKLTQQSDASLASDPELDDLAVLEGRVLAALHLRRERSPKLRQAKIDAIRRQGRPVACEVCQFDFAATYGALGEGYIEVHHVLPLHASGPVQTRLDDLALLCPNCHRMIHRARPWLTPDALATIVAQQR